MTEHNSTPKDDQYVNLVVDDVSISVEKGTTILEAAKQAGTEVPHYCYHAGLSSPAQCRLCLVEVEGAPKLMPSCTTVVTEGQVVRTDSDVATKMRQGVLEFYLVNHPLDCPICDQSGECDLQDFVFSEGRKHGRSRAAKRVLGRDDFGGDVLFYGDRCVMCTRCVRFMEEVEEKPLLSVVERGNRSVIDTFFDQGLGDAEWAGNIVDICPVGALVSKDFLYKARAWDLEHTPSICPYCSMGCNIDIHTRDNVVQRFKPRENKDVNGHWMCDYGRSRYEWLNEGKRIEEPLSTTSDGGLQTSLNWEEALIGLGEKLKSSGGRLKVIASPLSSNEDVGATVRLIQALGGGEIVFRSATTSKEVPLPGFKGLKRTKYLAPNIEGLKVLGAKYVGDEKGSGGLQAISQHTEIVLVMGDRLEDQTEKFGSEAELLIYLGSHFSEALQEADFIFPINTFAETSGTFTNCDRRVQKFSGSLEGPCEARPAWSVLNDLVSIITGSESSQNVADAFNQLSGTSEVFAGTSYSDLMPQGFKLKHDPQMTRD